MKKIIIVNALGFGEEVAGWISLMPGYGIDFALKGFLDDRVVANPMLPILGNPQNYAVKEEDEFVIALSDPATKLETAARLKMNGARFFFNVIHPENSLSLSFIPGEGLIIAPYNSISNRVVAGDFVSIYGFCKIGHDVRIGNFCHIASHCSIDGFSTISDKTNLPSFTKVLKNSTV